MLSDYPYQLTKPYKTEKECKDDCKEIIKQIEACEGKGKGYSIRQSNGKWAVYTRGDLVLTREEYIDIKNSRQENGDFTILQVRDVLKDMKNV